MVVIDASDPISYKIEVTDSYRAKLFTLPKDVTLFYIQPDVCWKEDNIPYSHGIWGFSGAHPNEVQHYAEYKGESDFIIS